MSAVIDGKDILEFNSYLAAAMQRGLGGLLNGGKKGIPVGVLHDAKNLFSAGMRYIHEESRDAEVHMTYKLLIDMLKRVKKMEKDKVNTELEKLAIALEVLTPDGKQVIIAPEHYRTLKNLFWAMHKESRNYNSHYDDGHSPYSIGTFDDDSE